MFFGFDISQLNSTSLDLVAFAFPANKSSSARCAAPKASDLGAHPIAFALMACFKSRDLVFLVVPLKPPQTGYPKKKATPRENHQVSVSPNPTD